MPVVPIHYTDLSAAQYLSLRLHGFRSGNEVFERLCDNCFGASRSSRAFLVNSGRAALTIALRAMMVAGTGNRRAVVIPAYVCPSVPDAVRRLKLVPRYAPVGRDLNFDLEALERSLTGDVLAVVAVSTYGYPAPLASIERIAAARGIWLIDDAAHCPPGREARGAAAIHSFALSKALSNGYSGRGGILVINDDRLLSQVAIEYGGLQRVKTSIWDDAYFLLTCVWEPFFARLPWRVQSWIQTLLAANATDPWLCAKMSQSDAALALAQLQAGVRLRAGRGRRAREILSTVADGSTYWFPHRQYPDQLTRLAVCFRAELSPAQVATLEAAVRMRIRRGYSSYDSDGVPFRTVFEIPIGAAWQATRLERLASALGSAGI